MLKLRKKLKSFRSDEGGYSTAEFVIVATTFLTGFFWIFETGLIMTKQMMLERAIDMTVRDLRLYSIPPTQLETETTYQWAKRQTCENALVFKDCEENLHLEMDTFDPASGYAKNYKCVDREENDLNPLGAFTPNQRSEIMYIRACIRVDPMMPNGIALFPGVNEEGIPLVADTAFMNEPE
ncbi:pilus assembly protein [Amylibacter sp. IMCC11727]|uniref:TadE/TadG family type IV pilus assembly protein n=1 Tax=Amylibacter sp. IMCC11727 TaxID=3039851 RepID=UPI00244E4884|nr:pilus assembly protein [Amylibacter sp. IMCC11727]WGI21815.1 pilus assembly protein [Amylibacter sp. IMCC11727]